jgi:hypothetical protein
VIELAVLIAARHLVVHDSAFNLAMVYDGYMTHMRSAATDAFVGRAWSKSAFAAVRSAHAFPALCMGPLLTRGGLFVIY